MSIGLVAKILWVAAALNKNKSGGDMKDGFESFMRGLLKNVAKAFSRLFTVASLKKALAHAERFLKLNAVMQQFIKESRSGALTNI